MQTHSVFLPNLNFSFRILSLLTSKSVLGLKVILFIFILLLICLFFFFLRLNIQNLKMRTETLLSMPIRLTLLSCTLSVYFTGYQSW